MVKPQCPLIPTPLTPELLRHPGQREAVAAADSGVRDLDGYISSVRLKVHSGSHILQASPYRRQSAKPGQLFRCRVRVVAPAALLPPSALRVA